MDFPFPVLAIDIGGTNARFSLITGPGAAPSPGIHRPTHAFPGLEAAIEDAAPDLPGKAKSIIACAAGLVEGRRVTMTNAHWVIDGGAVAQRLGLAQGLLLNDFEAQALSLPVIRDEWTIPIGGPFKTSAGAKLILGPGTGLGVSVLLEIEGKHFALATESGHIDFGPLGSEEAAIWPHLPMTPLGRVSAEFLVSGPGLVRLHRARLTSQSMIISREIDEKQIVETAQADPHGEEAQTIRLFWRLTARYAGDMALAFLAKGGVTFSGGVLPRLIAFADPVMFRARFEDKAPFGDVMRGIGTRLIVAEDTVIPGMAAIAAHPGDYALDYRGRAWR